MVDYSEIIKRIQRQYLKDNIPWIVGYSGGKDSTCVLQMIFQALRKLPKDRLNKEIHVICNDTLVENPIIAKYVEDQLSKIEQAGKGELFPHNPDLFQVEVTKPTIDDSFWVCLIGKGYPSPNRWFRWCTERLKINPTSAYIKRTLDEKSSAIIVLGTRESESANRASAMRKYDNGQALRKHQMDNAFVYAPIVEMSDAEVWAYLLQVPKPWGGSNKDLLRLYGSACKSGECPMVQETNQQSCGDSRFGCWVCTVVDEDKSLAYHIQNSGNGDGWMQELLEFRNWIYRIRNQDEQYVPSYISKKARFGPFLMKTRYELLDKLIDMNERALTHDQVLITDQEITRINQMLSRDKNDNSDREDRKKKYVYELPSGRRLAAIADYDLFDTERQRLAGFSLKNAETISIRRMSEKYHDSTRVMFYEEK
jgi:DNA sulfur modification protein DndC